MIRADGGFEVNGSTVLHSSNYNSYALPLTGGTVTGAVTVNGGDLRVDGGRNLRIGDGSDDERILIQKIDNNISDHIIFYNGTTRIGEIGCEDNSWLRINQETAKNIYTPRLIRADGGFQVNGSTVVDSNKNLAVPANADLNLANGTWTGNHTKIQHHSNTLYIVGGTNGIILRESGTNRWHMDGSGHFVPGGNANYDIGDTSNLVRYVYSTRFYPNGTSRYITGVTGNYGTIEVKGSNGGWAGYSIDGRVVFMHNGSTGSGIYNDVNNEWMLTATLNGGVSLYYNASLKLETVNSGVLIMGSCNPNLHNQRDLGASNLRWATLYVVNQPNVSDRNEKNTIQHSDLGLSFINKLNPVSFKWNDTSLGTKTRYGLIVQEVEEAAKELGKDPDDMGMIDKPKDGSMGLCTNELIAPLVKAIQELSAKVAALEAA